MVTDILSKRRPQIEVFPMNQGGCYCARPFSALIASKAVAKVGSILLGPSGGRCGLSAAIAASAVPLSGHRPAKTITLLLPASAGGSGTCGETNPSSVESSHCRGTDPKRDSPCGFIGAPGPPYWGKYPVGLDPKPPAACCGE